MHRTAMVVSDRPGYAPMTQGVTGLKARTPADFATHPLRLVRDADPRGRIGVAAHAQVLQAQSVAAPARAWRRFATRAQAS